MAVTFKYYNTQAGAYQTLNPGSYIPFGWTRIQIGGLPSSGAQTIRLRRTYSDQSTEDIFSRTFYPGLGNVIDLDVREDLADRMSLVNLSGPHVPEANSFMYLTLSCGSANVSFFATIQEDYPLWTLSDVDAVAVDAGTTLRLAMNNPQTGPADPENIVDGGTEEDSADVFVLTRRGKEFVSTETFTGVLRQPVLETRFDVSSLPVRMGEPFRLVFGDIEDVGTPAPSPVYVLKQGRAEQYLFRNRYGAFDVLPMFGGLSFAPDFSIASGSYADSRFRLQGDVDEAYVQNTGYLSRRTMAALSSLLLSRQIYHKVDGVWRQIIVEETDLSLSFKESLHSCTFKFRYADKSVRIHETIE